VSPKIEKRNSKIENGNSDFVIIFDLDIRVSSDEEVVKPLIR